MKQLEWHSLEHTPPPKMHKNWKMHYLIILKIEKYDLVTRPTLKFDNNTALLTDKQTDRQTDKQPDRGTTRQKTNKIRRR